MSDSTQVVINQSSLEVAKNTRGWTYTAKSYGSTIKEIEDNTRALIKVAEVIIKEKGDEE